MDGLGGRDYFSGEVDDSVKGLHQELGVAADTFHSLHDQRRLRVARNEEIEVEIIGLRLEGREKELELVLLLGL